MSPLQLLEGHGQCIDLCYTEHFAGTYDHMYNPKINHEGCGLQMANTDPQETGNVEG